MNNKEQSVNPCAGPPKASQNGAQGELLAPEECGVPPEPKPKVPRPRNVLLDALVSVDGSDPLQCTGPSFRAAATALSEIKKVKPDVTPDEIGRRADNYRKHFPSVSISASALGKHWGKCDKPPVPAEKSLFFKAAMSVINSPH